MNSKISVVINTLNDEETIERVIKSVNWANEVIVCDMHSEDKTVEIAKKLNAKVFNTKKLEYVEPARNFAISKTTSEWVLILDPDEQVSENLKNELIRIASENKQVDYVRIPRKNIIFGKWMKASMWWPDYNIRFFKKGKVTWGDKIHRPPQTNGEGLDISESEELAIIHYHYQSITQFLDRMVRYTKIQAQELVDEGDVLEWQGLMKKPMSEFLRIKGILIRKNSRS